MGAGAASNQGCCELPEVKVAPRDLASNTDEAGGERKRVSFGTCPVWRRASGVADTVVSEEAPTRLERFDSRARRMSIQRRFLQWKYQWDVLGFSLLRPTVEAQTKGRFPDQAKRLLDEINGQVKKMKRYVAEQVRALEEGKDYRRAIRAKMRKKRTRDDGSPLSGIVRPLRGLPARGRRAHRPPAVLQRGVPARALGRGAQGRVPVRALNLDP